MSEEALEALERIAAWTENHASGVTKKWMEPAFDTVRAALAQASEDAWAHRAWAHWESEGGQ